MIGLLSAAAATELVNLIDSRIAEALDREDRPVTQASPWLTVSEAADYLRTTPAAVRKRISRGQLKAYRPEGSRIMLHRTDLDAAGPEVREVL